MKLLFIAVLVSFSANAEFASLPCQDSYSGRRCTPDEVMTRLEQAKNEFLSRVSGKIPSRLDRWDKLFKSQDSIIDAERETDYSWQFLSPGVNSLMTSGIFHWKLHRDWASDNRLCFQMLGLFPELQKTEEGFYCRVIAHQYSFPWVGAAGSRSGDPFVGLKDGKLDRAYFDRLMNSIRVTFDWWLINRDALIAMSYIVATESRLALVTQGVLDVAEQTMGKETAKNDLFIELKMQPLLKTDQESIYFMKADTIERLQLKASGAVENNDLPETIEGFKTSDVMALFKEGFGADALEKLTIKKRNKIYYSLPALKVLVQVNREPITKILNQNWIGMPLETSSVWAIQEMSIAQNKKPEELAVATANKIYIDRAQYSQFMTLYRGNKQALAGDKIAGAMEQLRGDMNKQLSDLRVAVETNGANTKESIDLLRERLGPELNGIKWATWISAIMLLLR